MKKIIDSYCSVATSPRMRISLSPINQEHSVHSKLSGVLLVMMLLNCKLDFSILAITQERLMGNLDMEPIGRLRNFQEKYGLPVDGIAGSKTKKKLVDASNYDEKFVKENLNKGNKFTHYGEKPLVFTSWKRNREKKNVQLPAKYSDQDLKLMANAVYGEARGEPYEGQVAVAAVILNRVEHPDFPDTVGGVIFQPVLLLQSQMDKYGSSRMNVQKRLFLMPSTDGILPKTQFTISIRSRLQVNGFGHDHKLRKSVCIFFVTDVT